MAISSINPLFINNPEIFCEIASHLELQHALQLFRISRQAQAHFQSIWDYSSFNSPANRELLSHQYTKLAYGEAYIKECLSLMTVAAIQNYPAEEELKLLSKLENHIDIFKPVIPHLQQEACFLGANTFTIKELHSLIDNNKFLSQKYSILIAKLQTIQTLIQYALGHPMGNARCRADAKDSEKLTTMMFSSEIIEEIVNHILRSRRSKLIYNFDGHLIPAPVLQQYELPQENMSKLIPFIKMELCKGIEEKFTTSDIQELLQFYTANPSIQNLSLSETKFKYKVLKNILNAVHQAITDIKQL